MRLRRSDPAKPGIRRVRRGKGFGYVDRDGHSVDAATKERIRSLVIPPAWEDVWICPWPNGHIQAVGTDAAGRRQYLYHPAWHETRGRDKHERVLTLARRLPEARAEIGRRLRRDGLGRERVGALALRLLDAGLFRTGGEEYESENGSYGVATLRKEHVTVSGDVVSFCFPAKSGVEREAEVRDPALAKAVSASSAAAERASASSSTAPVRCGASSARRRSTRTSRSSSGRSTRSRTCARGRPRCSLRRRSPNGSMVRHPRRNAPARRWSGRS